MTYWAACYTDVAGERKARDGIEALDRGTLLPTFAKIYYDGGRRKAFERPILNRYILVALYDKTDPAWSQINHVEGVHSVLQNNGLPMRVSDNEIVNLTLAHVMGACNVVQARSANGRFTKPRMRRARPRAGKKVRNLTYIKGQNPHVISQGS